MPAHSPRLSPADGVISGIGANLCWTLAVTVPLLMPGVDVPTLTAGRYLLLGGISALLLLQGERPRLQARDWGVALSLALTGNVGYYLLFASAIRLADAPTTAIILSALPVSVAVAGNLHRAEYRWHALAVPLRVTASGIALTNIDAFHHIHTGGNTWWAGIACAFGAMGSWTLYAIWNADYVARRPRMSASSWSSVVGFATLPLAILTLPWTLRRAARPGFDWIGFLLGSILLGLIASWLATLLWNRASAKLPVSLAGQLIVIESGGDLVLAHLLTATTPRPLEIAGYILSMTGVLFTLRLARRPDRKAEGK